MKLTFAHDCLPQVENQVGCPIAGREIDVDSPIARLNEFSVPDVRCLHTKKPLKLVAIDHDRDI